MSKIKKRESEIFEENKKNPINTGIEQTLDVFYSLFDNLEKIQNFGNNIGKECLIEVMKFFSCSDINTAKKLIKQIQNLSKEADIKSFAEKKQIYDISKFGELVNIINKKTNEMFNETEKYLFYTEIVLKIRSSQILVLQGYCYEGISLLRTAFELNNGLKAMREGVITPIEYVRWNEEEHKKYKEKDDLKQVDFESKYRNNLNRKARKCVETFFENEDALTLDKFEHYLNSALHGATISISHRRKTLAEGFGIIDLFKPVYSEDNLIIYHQIVCIIIMMTFQNLKKEVVNIYSDEHLKFEKDIEDILRQIGFPEIVNMLDLVKRIY